MTRLRKHNVHPLGFKTDAESLIACLQGDVEENTLSAKLKEKLERVITCKSLLFEHKFTSKVVKMMVRTFRYSEISAYRDMRLTNLIFGPILAATKEMKRAIAEEMIRQDRELGRQQKDIRSLTASTANYIKLHQLDKDDAEMPDVSAFIFHQNIIAVLPGQVGIDPMSDESLLESVDEWIGNTEDVSHEEVS